MNDTVDNTASSLAVVEKKPQRPGGCVGIFFQLFDWNRRFAKKKLFSKKLLPPVRFKQASKKFGGDEKQPKLRLIADENSGGFPNAKSSNGAANVDNEQKNETRVPGLVVRLMGLESLPATQREKSKKVPQSGSVCGKPEKLVKSREELDMEKGGGVKHELRPQKLQKTSVRERQPITKFGAEKLPFKNVLSKSRKHQTKLPSPVKSPINLSRKRSSRLIGAATRILEPGLQTSKSKCALTYSNNLRHPTQETCMEERIHTFSSQVGDSDGFETVAIKGESSCRNCGYSLDNSTCKSTMCEQPLVFASPFPNCVGSGSSCSERSNAAFDKELEEELHEEYPYKSPYDGQIQGHLGGQQCNPSKGAHLSHSSNYKPHRQNQMFHARERVPPRPNLYSVTNGNVSTSVMNGTKSYVSANQKLSCNTRPRVPSRMDNGRFQLEKRVTNSMNDLETPGRKRRPTNMSRQGEYSGFTVSGKQFGYDARLINQQKGRVGLVQGQDRTFNCGHMGNNVVSFPFNSPVKQRSGTYKVAERRAKCGLCCDKSLQKSDSGENSRKTKFEKPCLLSGDALGALLEQKLKELNSQGEDLGNAPKKTTAMILQELITALTSDVPLQLDNLPAISDRRNGWCSQSPLSNSTSFIHSQANTMGMKLSVDLPPDSEYLSPGSVLEAYFSTESCPSSSLDESLGYKMPNESLDCSCYGPHSPNPDSESFNLTASLNTAESSKELVLDILNNVSEILCCSNLAFGLHGYKLDQAKEVLLNSELVFYNTPLSGPVSGRGSPIKRLLLDEFETLVSVLWMNFGCCLGIEDGKELNQIKTFVLDTIIEYLGEKYQGYPQCGSRITQNLHIHVNSRVLMLEIVKVVRRWEELSRLGLDELIEKEMSRSLGEWTECETEGFEIGLEISRHVFWNLIDEIVMDVWKY